MVSEIGQWEDDAIIKMSDEITVVIQSRGPERTKVLIVKAGIKLLSMMLISRAITSLAYHCLELKFGLGHGQNNDC